MFYINIIGNVYYTVRSRRGNTSYLDASIWHTITPVAVVSNGPEVRRARAGAWPGETAGPGSAHRPSSAARAPLPLPGRSPGSPAGGAGRRGREGLSVWPCKKLSPRGASQAFSLPAIPASVGLAGGLHSTPSPPKPAAGA